MAGLMNADYEDAQAITNGNQFRYINRFYDLLVKQSKRIEMSGELDCKKTKSI
jgi:hypothetical protein